MQRQAGEQARIVVGERAAYLEGLLQVLGQVRAGSFRHSVQVALRVIVLGDGDFHLGVERQRVEVGCRFEDRRDVVHRNAMVGDVHEADAAADIGDLLGERTARIGVVRPGRAEVNHGHVSEYEFARCRQHWKLPDQMPFVPKFAISYRREKAGQLVGARNGRRRRIGVREL